MSKPKSRQQRRAQERDRAERLHSRPQTSQRPLLLAAAGVVGVIAVIAALVVVKLSQGNSTADSRKAQRPRSGRRGATPSPPSPRASSTLSATSRRLRPRSTSPARRCARTASRSWCSRARSSARSAPPSGGRSSPRSRASARSTTWARRIRRASTNDPDTATFSFHKATYTSKYITLDTVEVATNQPQGNYYKLLEKPTALEQRLSAKYDPDYIPFVYLRPTTSSTR